MIWIVLTLMLVWIAGIVRQCVDEIVDVDREPYGVMRWHFDWWSLAWPGSAYRLLWDRRATIARVLRRRIA